MEKKKTVAKTPAKAKRPPVKKSGAKKTTVKKSGKTIAVVRMEKGRKATKAQHNKILEEVAKLISDLHTRRYIQQYLAKRWGISGSQADNYMMQARKLYRNELPDPQQAVADLLEKLIAAEKTYRGRGMSHLMALKQMRELIVPTRVHIGGDPQSAPIKTEVQQIVKITPAAILEAAAILKEVGAIEDDNNTDTPE